MVVDLRPALAADHCGDPVCLPQRDIDRSASTRDHPGMVRPQIEPLVTTTEVHTMTTTSQTGETSREYRVIGTRPARADGFDKVTGAAKFGPT